MYEHPIKRAGLSMNRILFSNTRMVMAGFPKSKPAQFNLSFKFKTYENGKEQSKACKLTHEQTSTVLCEQNHSRPRHSLTNAFLDAFSLRCRHARRSSARPRWQPTVISIVRREPSPATEKTPVFSVKQRARVRALVPTACVTNQE